MRLLGAGRSFGCFFILWRGTEYADNHADKKEAIVGLQRPFLKETSFHLSKVQI